MLSERNEGKLHVNGFLICVLLVEVLLSPLQPPALDFLIIAKANLRPQAPAKFYARWGLGWNEALLKKTNFF